VSGNRIATDASQRVRVVKASTGTFYGQAITAGDIDTIVGNGTSGFAPAAASRPPAPSSREWAGRPSTGTAT
jgi:hypothetical protein